MAITLLLFILFQFNIKTLLHLEGRKEGGELALGRGFQDEPTTRRKQRLLFSGETEAAVVAAAVEMVTAVAALAAAMDIVIVPTAEIRGCTLF